MKLLHRRLYAELTTLFCICLLSLLSLVILGRVLQLRELIMTLGLSLWDILLLFLYLSPFFMLLILPVACMIAVFLTFLRMSSDNELLALKSGGISLYRLAPPTLVFCVVCFLITLFTSLYGLSWGMTHFRNTLIEYARTKTRLVIQPGVFNKNFPGLTIYAQNVDMSQGVLDNIIVEDRRDSHTVTILAPLGMVQTVPEKGQMVIALNNGMIYQQQDDNISVLSFDNYQVRLDLTNLLKDYDIEQQKPKEMSWKQLKNLSHSPDVREQQGDNFFRKVRLELHKRWVFPVACIVLGLFALPLACTFEGLNRQYGFFLALGFFLVYYSMISLGLSLGESGVLPPWLGLWLPNIAFLLMSVLGLRLAAQESSLNIVEWIKHWRIWRRQGA